jgi:hypothetical protein
MPAKLRDRFPPPGTQLFNCSSDAPKGANSDYEPL